LRSGWLTIRCTLAIDGGRLLCCHAPGVGLPNRLRLTTWTVALKGVGHRHRVHRAPVHASVKAHDVDGRWPVAFDLGEWLSGIEASGPSSVASRHVVKVAGATSFNACERRRWRPTLKRVPQARDRRRDLRQDAYGAPTGSGEAQIWSPRTSANSASGSCGPRPWRVYSDQDNACQDRGLR